MREIKGSPTDCKLDATEVRDLVEQEDRRMVGLDPGLESRVGSRAGERRAMYLSKKDFVDHGFTGGCTGCRDLATGKRTQIALHTAACRKRMEDAVRERDPDRWERFLLRRRQEESAQDNSGGKGGAPSVPLLHPAADPSHPADPEGGWGG